LSCRPGEGFFRYSGGGCLVAPAKGFFRHSGGVLSCRPSEEC
jgi:hypothetical protein